MMTRSRFLRVLFPLAAALAASRAAPARADEAKVPVKHPGWSFAAARKIPVQAGGRIKPLDSLAHEMALFQTGSRSFEGWDPVDMLFSQVSAPEVWEHYRFIQISREDVRRQLGLDDKRTRFAPSELVNNAVLGQYAMSASSRESQVSAPISVSPKADPRDQEFKRVFDRVGLFRRIISGDAWSVIPPGPNMEAAATARGMKASELPWLPISDAEKEKGGEDIRGPFVDMLRAYQLSNQRDFDSASERMVVAVEAKVPGWTSGMKSRISVEAYYNKSRPFLWSWIIYLCAALAWVVARTAAEGAPAGKPSKAVRRWTLAALSLTGAASLCLIAGIVMRCYVAGRPPVTNMYESIIWVCIGQVLFASILYAIHRQAIVLLVSCVLATIGLIAADSAPAVMDPGLHPLVPVLRSNYWLTIHVLTITLGYAAFALTLGLGNVSLYHFLRAGRPGAPEDTKTKIASMNQLTYRAMQFGVVLLAAGTILGGVWADYSWGRFWGWDPKEVWALIALLCYLVILHARFTGWMTQFGFAMWSVLSFLSVLMAWYGVNFVLGVGLHSYGFASGGFGPIGTFVSAQLAWVGVVAYFHKRRPGASAVGSPTPSQAS